MKLTSTGYAFSDPSGNGKTKININEESRKQMKVVILRITTITTGNYYTSTYLNKPLKT